MGGRTLNVAYAEPKGADQVPAQQVKVKRKCKHGDCALGCVCVSTVHSTTLGLTLCMLLQSVYVGNLPASATELKLKELFEQFGEVCACSPALSGLTHLATA